MRLPLATISPAVICSMGLLMLSSTPRIAVVAKSIQQTPNYCLSQRSFRQCVRLSSTLSKESSIDYVVAASFSGKGRKFDPQINFEDFGQPRLQKVKFEPVRSSRPASGQDSFFASRLGNNNGVAFGVADGVGGWVESGVDPADFAHDFCHYMKYFSSQPRKSGNTKARDVMQFGYDSIVKSKTVEAGGSTACVAVADEHGSMEVANLGDSGFVHIRLDSVIYSSAPQLHAFNTPYQLSVIPQKLREQEERFGSRRLHDMPNNADVTTHHVQKGDILVFASDGVWDNIYPSDVPQIIGPILYSHKLWVETSNGTQLGPGISTLTVKEAMSTNDSQDTIQTLIANTIAGHSKQFSISTTRDGPFAHEVHKYYPNEHWHGGKPDDICVVIAVAV